MGSLFLRIFLSFWMAVAIFLVAAILVTLALRPRTTTWEALRTTVLNDAVNAYEEGGETKVQQYLESVETANHVRAFLFDERGIEISHRAAPDWAIRIATGGRGLASGGILMTS